MSFIVFEGGEGVGKSTQLKLLFSALEQIGKKCILTREPGGTPFAENIRDLFKQMNSHKDEPTPLTELLLISAARAQHIQKLILPELHTGSIILCDRFLDSTYVYQCIVGKVDKKIVDKISALILGDLIPTLTLVFVSDTKKALMRSQQEEKRKHDRLDSFSEDIHEKINSGYIEVFEKEFCYPNSKIPKRVLIDANGTIEEIFVQVKNIVKETTGIIL